MPTDRRSWAAALGAALLLVSGCTRPAGHPAPQPEPATPASSTAPTGTSPTTTAPATPSAALQASFTELAATVPATIGIATAAVGSTTALAFGSWSTGVAWSTIKVPLAIAAQRIAGADVQSLITRAITQSDNAAAEQLWSQLGPPQTAAGQVQAVLREGGDDSTTVESQRLRPGFTAFGQTRWSLELQARFAAQLPCIADAGNVVDLMHQLGGGQRWGLAAEDAAAKGGWGPDESGAYLVRQFGIVPAADGRIGVALAAAPSDGTFASGIAALNRMAQWLTAHTGELPAGDCTG